MSDELLIAYDPGKITGAAACMFDPESKEVKSFQGVQGSVNDMLDSLWQMALAVPDGMRVRVGYERFTITQQTTKLSRQYDPLDFIGGLKWIAHHCTLDLLDPTDPATAKRTVNDDKLRRLSMWVVGAEHARDAARHLVLMLLKFGWYSSVFD